jgi:hypothetical protein
MQVLGTSVEILDLRHFAASVLRPILDAEGELWEQRLHWDYHASARLLMQYLDNHMLPGFASLESGRVTGYVFCVYEENKSVIGDVFALPGAADGAGGGLSPVPLPGNKRCSGTFLSSCSTRPTLTASSRNCSSIPPGPVCADIFRAAMGSRSSVSLFLVQSAGRDDGARRIPRICPANLELRPWREADLAPAARLICEAYRDHPDSLINDQYRSAHGSMRFLNNIVRYAGCGAFATQASYRGGRARQPRTGGPRPGLARQRAERAPDPGLRPSRLPPPRAGPHAARPGGLQLHAPRRRRDLAHRHGSQRRRHPPLQRRRLPACTHSFDAAVWQRRS